MCIHIHIVCIASLAPKHHLRREVPRIQRIQRGLLGHPRLDQLPVVLLQVEDFEGVCTDGYHAVVRGVFGELAAEDEGVGLLR
jgi:hypothetical protein